MSLFNTWFRAALCGCTLTVGNALTPIEAAQPKPPGTAKPTNAATQPAPLGEKIPRPAFPAEEPTVQVDDSKPKEAPKPPPQKPLSELSIDIRPTGASPANAAAEDHYLAPTEVEPNERGWNETVYFWQASNMAHQPLYFEQAYVERYGYNYRCLQPVVSGIQFCGDFATLPAKMVVRRPGECVWTLGYGRPGSQGVPCPRY